MEQMTSREEMSTKEELPYPLDGSRSSCSCSMSQTSKKTNRRRNSISKFVDRIRRTISSDEKSERSSKNVEDGDDDGSKSPKISYFRKYWIEPKDRRDRCELINNHQDEPDCPNLGQALGTSIEHQYADKIVEAAAGHAKPASAKSDFVEHSGFFFRDAFVQQVLEADYYWYDNERQRREQEKDMYYDMRRRQTERQMENPFMEAAENALAVSCWAWRPP